MFLYNKGLFFIGLFFFLTITTYIFFDSPENPEIELNFHEYSFYLNHVKGQYLEKKDQFILNESNKVSTANIALQKAYEDYYDGKITKAKLVSLTLPLEKIVQYEAGFRLIFDQYMYVRENPDDRYFLYTNGWNGLLSTDDLDFLFILLLLALITPVFCQEFESKMNSLNLTVKKGTRDHALSKVVVVLLTVITLTVLNSCLRYGFFHFKYGLENGNYPLQSLSYFETSTKNISLFSTYIGITVMKIFGNISFAMLIMFVSVYIKKYAFTQFISMAVILLPYYGFTLESTKYFLPGPLGFMISIGFFRGNVYEFNMFANQDKVLFREISNISWLFLFIITLVVSIATFIMIMKRSTNIWSISTRGNWFRQFMLLFLLFTAVSILGACKVSENTHNNISNIFNFSTRQVFENKQYNFYLDENDIDGNNFLFKDKETGEIRNFISDPLKSQIEVKNSIYGDGSLVYYIKYDYEKSKFTKALDRFSVIEVDTTNFEERIIFEKNINTEKERLLNLYSVNDAEILSFTTISSFFLDEQNIYLISNDEIRSVNRFTGKINIIIRYPILRSVGFDGRNIYYVNEKYQVVKYDTKKNIEVIIPDIITTNFILTDTKILFLNRKDQQKIYSMNLEDSTIRKLNNDSVLSFTLDDNFIIFENKANLETYRMDMNGEKVQLN